MPEKIEVSYRRAKSSSRVGSLCMYLLATLSGVNFLLFAYTSTSANTSITQPPIEDLLIALAATLLTTAAIFLLGEFFRHFGKDCSPFGKRQSLRLLAAAVLFTARTILDVLSPEPGIVHSLSSSNPTLYVTSQPGPDLKVVVMVVFLICLAMVIRYGNALKEDSDSIA